MKEFAGTTRDYQGPMAKGYQDTNEKEFNWVLNIAIALLGLGMIGGWATALMPIAVATITHDAIALPQPPDLLLAGLTFVMLAGVALVAIEVAKIAEKLLAHN